LLNSSQQEAEYELEVIELPTAAVHVYEGLEGGFIVNGQHNVVAVELDAAFDASFCLPFDIVVISELDTSPLLWCVRDDVTML
jgi:hypothetical protein